MIELMQLIDGGPASERESYKKKMEMLRTLVETGTWKVISSYHEWQNKVENMLLEKKM